MWNRTTRAAGATAVLVGIAIAALAQSDSGDPSSMAVDAPLPEPSASGQDDSAATDASPAPDGTPGFEHRVGLLSGPTTDNYWSYLGEQPTVWNSYVLGPTKPALYVTDPETQMLTPELAAEPTPARPTRDANGWRVHVEINPDMTWSDGRPITAEDFAFTFETVRRLGLEGGWAEAFPATIEAVVAESPDRIRIDMADRPSLRVWPYGAGLAPVMPAHVWSDLIEDTDDAAELYDLPGADDVSGGPLVIVEADEDQVVTRANPGHGSDTQIDVTFEIFADEGTAANALRSGAIDTVLSPKGFLDANAESLASTREVTVRESPAHAVRYLGFNLTRQPMADRSFRRAVALLFDRDRAVKDLVPDATAASTVLTPHNTAWFDPEAASELIATYEGALEDRLAAALQMLAESGYEWTRQPAAEDGDLVPGEGLTIGGAKPAPLTILTPGDAYDPTRPQYADRIGDVLETLGFEAITIVTDFDSVIDLAFSTDGSGSRQYDMYLLGWTLGNPALPGYHRSLFASDGIANSTGYASSSFDAALEAFESSHSLDDAKEALWEMESLIARDLPYLVLYHPQITEAFRSDRVSYGLDHVLGGIQGRLGGLGDVRPVS